MKNFLNIAGKVITSICGFGIGLVIGLSDNAVAGETAFNMALSLIVPMTLTETQELSFPDTVYGTTTNVITAPADARAAQFTAYGTPGSVVTGSVVENNVKVKTGDGVGVTKKITIRNFKTGGDMNASGVATFDNTGYLNDLRIGATAKVRANDIAGTYSGTATFRLVMN